MTGITVLLNCLDSQKEIQEVGLLRCSNHRHDLASIHDPSATHCQTTVCILSQFGDQMLQCLNKMKA